MGGEGSVRLKARVEAERTAQPSPERPLKWGLVDVAAEDEIRLILLDERTERGIARIDDLPRNGQAGGWTMMQDDPEAAAFPPLLGTPSEESLDAGRLPRIGETGNEKGGPSRAVSAFVSPSPIRFTPRSPSTQRASWFPEHHAKGTPSAAA